MKRKNKHNYKVTFTQNDVDSCIAIALAEKRGASDEIIQVLTGLSPGQISYRLKVGKELDGLPKNFGYRRWYRSARNTTVLEELRKDMPQLAAEISDRLGNLRVKQVAKFTTQDLSPEPLTVDQAVRVLRRQKRLLAA